MIKLSQTAVTLCWFFIAVTFLIHIDTLYDGHNWGGDFAQYILSAKNLLEGRPYNEHILLDMKITYPPGFSFLLMPLVKWFGINLKVFKLLNILFWYLSIACTYHLLKKDAGRDTAILTCLLLSISSNFFLFKQNILSDVPFVFFTLLVFCLFRAYEDEKRSASFKSVYFVLFVLCLAFSFLIRTAGFITFASFIFFFFYLGKRKEAVLLAVIFALTILLQFSITGILPGKLSDTFTQPSHFLEKLFINSSMVWNTIFLFYIQDSDRLGGYLYKIFSQSIMYISPFIYGGVLWMFIHHWKQKTLKIFHIYILFSIGTLCFMFGFPNNPWGTSRFVYPLAVPLIAWLAEDGKKVFRNFGAALGKILLLVLILINIYNVRLIYDFNDDVFQSSKNRELIFWIKNNIKDNEAYLLWQALPMALFTGKVGAGQVWKANPSNLPDFLEYIEKYNITYLILTRELDDDLIKFYNGNPQIAQLVWENQMYYAFKLSTP